MNRLRPMHSLAVVLSVFACALPARARVELEYWLWDSGQLPAYKTAARAFEARNPDIKIKITQIGWTDYWISLTTSLIAESAPDVFVNHVARYPELVRNQTLLDLAPFVARDGIKPDDYLGQLYGLWGKDGRQYGLPKDWDTIAIAYNRTMLAAAGIDPKELENLQWNPRDGGTFGRLIARLTLDEADENGLSRRFDPARVKQYGLIIDGQPDGFGQVEWSHFAVSNGFSFHDGPWSKNFHYDDPRLAETLQWVRDTSLDRHWIIPARNARQIGGLGLFAGKKGALVLTGSWMINSLGQNCSFPFGFSPLPIGPLGRKTMFNGLADSIWIGTRHPEEAWRWVKFLGSREGQMIVAESGVVFPAVREAAEKAAAVMNLHGADVSVFLRQATTPGGTFFYPITGHGSDLIVLTRAAMDEVVLGREDIGTILKKLNRDVNAFLQQPD